jgi:hypothetical protein
VKGKVVAEFETLCGQSGYSVFCRQFESRGLSNSMQATFDVSFLSCSWSFVCNCLHGL